jgi:EAL domain-containing protein (putative c-di-GMP-specific phosphodiesterase class I)
MQDSEANEAVLGQLEHLRKMGCDLAQGHYLARPLPGEEVDPLLVDRLIS